jgi:hypothetical protein
MFLGPRVHVTTQASPFTSHTSRDARRGSETELADRSQSRKKSSSFAPDEYLTTTSPFSSPKASRRKVPPPSLPSLPSVTCGIHTSLSLSLSLACVVSLAHDKITRV